MNQKPIVAPISTQRSKSARLVAPWFVQDTEYPPEVCTYEPLVNGEETFKAVHMAIAEAKKSVDIICWGFQPSMYFIRDGKSPCIGELLMQKAKEGVEVRILGWEAPFNSAGFAEEANLPGKDWGYKDRAGQVSTDDQYAYDRWWFKTCAVLTSTVPMFKGTPVPLFVSRGFDAFERAEIVYQAKLNAIDADLSATTALVMGAAPSHHQKTVLIDYEVPDRAVGFVMGHNMLDEYWDTDAHTALKRGPKNKSAPNAGPRGDTPRQDISSQVSGPILEHLHHNFTVAWNNVVGVDLLKARNAKKVGPQLQCLPGKQKQLAQLLRTQPQQGKRDIERLYLQAVNNATNFIYIENQYFRWPPLAELIKQVVDRHRAWGRDPAIHGSLRLFVVTNVSDGGIGAGTVNTQRMLEALGRGDTIPELTKIFRVRRIRENTPPKPFGERHPYDLQGRKELKDWEDKQNKREKEIEDIESGKTNLREEFPGLKVHVCSLVAPDSPAGTQWMDVYIHSKLMIIDDVFTTHGSANINTRSMQVDSEMNIAHEWASVTRDLRRRLWALHTKDAGAQDDPSQAFEAWAEILRNNADRKDNLQAPSAPIIEFYYNKKILRTKTNASRAVWSVPAFGWVWDTGVTK